MKQTKIRQGKVRGYLYTLGKTVDHETVAPYQKIPENIPELKLGQKIIVVNKEHPLFLEQGTIIEKGHCYYRIEFVSTDGQLHRKSLWLPDHWIDGLPKELRSENL